MVSKMGLPEASKKSILFFILISLIFVGKSGFAQHQADTSKKFLLASLEKKAEPKYIIRKSNVVFPEILIGNEEEMLPYIEKFSGARRNYLIRMHTIGKYYLPKAATILKKYSLPEELSILLTLESAYNGNAVSKAGAVGYWQIIDEVAREYGMKYNAKFSVAERKKQLKLKGNKGEKQHKTVARLRLKDDRKNFYIATHAAARYLRDRSRNLDDNWLLVVASYNCGVGNVWNAMKRSGKLNPTFWDIKDYLPAETRTYVKNFITLNVIFYNYELFIKNNLSFVPGKVMLPEDLEKNMTEEQSDYSDL